MKKTGSFWRGLSPAPFGSAYEWQGKKGWISVTTSQLLRYVNNVGQPWIDVHREAISRLDKEEPIFYLVALQRKNWSSYVRYGESSYYSGLCIDEQGLLQKVNPEFTAEDVPVRFRCCTYTFNGERVPVTEKNWLKPYEKENWE